MATYTSTIGDYSRYKELKLNNDKGIMTVTISNPGKRNAINPEASYELAGIFGDLWIDPEVKVIILTGEGEHFSSGADIGTIGSASADAPESLPTNIVTYRAKRHVYGILECEKPVIAKIRGVAYGAAVNMALACDMAYAAEGARICDSHVKVGMVAGDGGNILWPLLIGMRRAKEYLMTGEPIPAEKAEELGLINRCVPDDQLDGVVQEMAEKLMALPPHAVNYTKASLNSTMKQMAGASFEGALGYEIYTQQMNDFKEATTAFIEKRPPRYTGS